MKKAKLTISLSKSKSETVSQNKNEITQLTQGGSIVLPSYFEINLIRLIKKNCICFLEEFFKQIFSNKNHWFLKAKK